MPKVDVQLVEQNKRARIVLTCESMTDKTQVQQVQQQLQHTIAKNFLILEEELNELIKDFNAMVDQFVTNEDAQGKKFSAIALEKKDATLSLIIAEDKMSVDADVITAYGGIALKVNTVIAQAKEQGIIFGLNKDIITALCNEQSTLPPGSIIRKQIGLGRDASPGSSAKLEQLVPCAKERILQPQEVDGGKVDMRNLGKIISVKPGTPMMRKVPARPGVNGTNVLGETLEAPNGADIELKAGEGTYIDPNNSSVLVAEKIGLPKLIDNGMAVKDVFEAPKVDATTGHIDYSGSVLINGDVGEGMRIVANGDVNISGYVDSAYIEAKGDVVIGKAAIGKQVELKEDDSDEGEENGNYSTIIKAEGNVFIRHAQYIEVTTNKKLVVEKQLLHSKVTAHSVVVGREEAPNGKLIGGTFALDHSLIAGTVGAPSGSRSVINLNQRYEKLIDKKEQLKHEITTQKKILSEIKTAVEHIKFLPHNEERKNLLNECVSNFENHKKLIQQHTRQLKMLEQHQRQIFSVVFIEIKERLFHGVELQISTDKSRTKRDYGPSKIRFNEGKIEIDPLI